MIGGELIRLFVNQVVIQLLTPDSWKPERSGRNAGPERVRAINVRLQPSFKWRPTTPSSSAAAAASAATVKYANVLHDVSCPLRTFLGSKLVDAQLSTNLSTLLIAC